MGKVVNLTDNDFDKTINETEGVTLVDFWAAWCAPCRMLGPILDEVAKDNDVTVAKVDTMKAKRTAGKFKIRRIPTVHIYKDGKKVDQFAGVLPKQQILDIISKWQ